MGFGSGYVEAALREVLPEGVETRSDPDLIRVSPDGKLMAVWKYSGEISMGVGRFEVRWGAAGQSFEELSPVVLPGFENDLLYPPIHGYQPWSWDSQSLLLTFFGRQRKRFGMITFPRRAPVLWEVETGRFKELDFRSDRFNAVLAAPEAPVAVVISRHKKGNAGFFDLPLGSLRGDLFSLSGQVCWQTSSGRLLAVVEERKPRKILLRAYDPNSGRLEAQIDLTGSIMAVLPAWAETETRLGGAIPGKPEHSFSHGSTASIGAGGLGAIRQQNVPGVLEAQRRAGS